MTKGDDVPPYPAKAEFACGAYKDGSGHQITIGYSTNDERWQNYIVIDGYTVTFEQQHAEEVIAAIRYCADAIRARSVTLGTEKRLAVTLPGESEATLGTGGEG